MPAVKLTQEFTRALPRLITAYDRGLLVPFLGAGMSRERCPDWTGLVTRLEREAQVETTPESQKADLVRRANRAVQRLALRSTEPAPRVGYLANALRRAIYDDAPSGDTPRQTLALAKLWWPLVITTNYDDLFAASYAEQHGDASVGQTGGDGAADQTLVMHSGAILRVLGRNRSDCQQVLTSLSVTSATVLWAIHGFLPHRADPNHDRLAAEVVVGHDEYRRLAHAEPYYRRAFAEVWRRRSFLFLGSSLADPYLLDLFSEVQELHGSTPQPHFALVADQQQDLDVEFLRSRFNIIAVRYGPYDDLTAHLQELGRQVQAPRPRHVRWSWHAAAPAGLAGPAHPEATLEIVHGPLPESLDGRERAAVSAGFCDPPHPKSCVYLQGAATRAGGQPTGIAGIADRLAEGFSADGLAGRLLARPGGRAFVQRDRGGRDAPVIALRPWRDRFTRDLRLIPACTRDALDWAAEHGAERLRVPLLGAGRSRHFPAAVALAQIIRAHRDWMRDTRRIVRLAIHVVDASALFELESGRLDVEELLTTSDLRLWAQVEGTDADRTIPEPMIHRYDTPLAHVAHQLGIADDPGWQVRIDPSPLPDAPWEALEAAACKVLGELAVLPGATVRFRRQ